jgi:hypothetical protein
VKRDDRILAAIGDEPVVEFEKRAGLCRSQIARIRERGSCGYYTLDMIACALGCHPSQFEVGR